MAFRIRGLDPQPFRHLFGLSDADLAGFAARRYRVDAMPGFPDRIEVRDLEIGETAILLNYEHQPADTAYRARHAIFIREGAETALDIVDQIPAALAIRPISVRAFDDAGDMVDAELIDGWHLAPVIDRFLANQGIAYLHAHYATRGCYAARIDRA